MRRDALIPAAKAAGVEWVGFHTLRHTCASLLFEQGRNIAQVSKWLGHADPGFTLRTYVHLMDEGVGGALSVDVAAPVGTLNESARASADAHVVANEWALTQSDDTARLKNFFPRDDPERAERRRMLQAFIDLNKARKQREEREAQDGGG